MTNVIRGEKWENTFFHYGRKFGEKLKTKIDNKKLIWKIEIGLFNSINYMYHIAIPSYNRAEILIKKTLQTLNKKLK
jgi:hypothetical protein